MSTTTMTETREKYKGKNWSARCRADRYAVCNCDYFDAV